MSIVRIFAAFSFLLIVATLVACYNDNPWYCEDRAYTHCGNAPGTFPCRAKEDCAGQDGKLSCSELDEATGFGICVQCTPSDAASCLGATPVCGADYLCRACGKHSDCASAACLSNGSCGSDADVAYVAAAGSGTACTKAAPCRTLAAAVAKGKAYVKVAAGGIVKDTQVTTIDGKAVTILADEGAKLDRDGDGAVIEVRSAGTDVKVFDLEITGATGASGANGIDLNPNGGTPKLTLTRVKLTGNQGLGLSMQGGAVAISQSTLSGNTGGGIFATGGTVALSQSTLSGNTGGGISISNGTFDITNNFIYGNGGLGTTVGGVLISTTQNALNRLEFNTLSRNGAQDTIGAGVQCLAGTFMARNNVVYGNGTVSNPLQVAGSCGHAYSDIGPMAASGGIGNINMDPMFQNIATGDLHVSATSPVRGVADPASNLSGAAATDIDGQLRTSPADIGADEVP